MTALQIHPDSFVLVSRRARRRGRARAGMLRVGNLLVAGILLAACGLWFVAFRPQGLGGPAEYVMIQGTSMNPVYHSGDLVVVRKQDTYLRGDIVAYRIEPGDIGAGLVVIHRIIGGSPSTGFVLQGDNNTSPDDWHVDAPDILGKAWALVPQAGLLFARLHDPLVLACLATSVSVAFYVSRDPSVRSRKPKRKRRAPGATP